MDIELTPIAGFWLSMACLAIGIVFAVGWAILDAHRERRRETARAIRKRELAQAHPEDWRPLIPRRWQIEGNLRYSLWTAGEAFRKLTRIFGGEAAGAVVSEYRSVERSEEIMAGAIDVGETNHAITLRVTHE